MSNHRINYTPAPQEDERTVTWHSFAMVLALMIVVALAAVWASTHFEGSSAFAAKPAQPVPVLQMSVQQLKEERLEAFRAGVAAGQDGNCLATTISAPLAGTVAAPK